MMELLRNTSILLALALTISCTPKITAPVVEVEAPKQVEKVEDDNPCTTLGELSSGQRDEVETAYVLYKDLVKLKKFDDAFPLWAKAYYGAPAANGSIKYQFEDGIKIYKYFYENAADPIQKQVYVDSIMAIYNKRVECYGEADYVASRMAFDRYYYFQEQSDMDDIYTLFKQAIDAKKEKVDYFVVNPFTKILSDKIIGEEISMKEARTYATHMLNAIEYGTATGKNKEAWDIINAYAPARLDNLEGIEGLYDCAYYEKKYIALLAESPEDCEVINRTYGRLLWGGCDRNAASVQQVAQAKQTNCYTPPPPDGPLKKAYNAYTEGRYKEAVLLFEEFVNSTDDVQKKAKYSLLIAKIYYGDIKNYVKSRQFARAAARYNPSSGEPNLLIGKLYASSGPLCGPGTGWDSQVVTWPAIDKWEQAKKDPQVAAEAQKLITTYKKYMPKKEDIFQRRIKAGDKYTVGCWINENTTVRTAN